MKAFQDYRIKLSIIILCFLIPYFLIYRSFFSTSPLSWGDAPYFYAQNLQELFYQPLLWNFRNDNFGQPQSSILWLFLPTFLYGVLSFLFHLSSEVLIRLIFYFPATILALLGSWLFIGQVTKNRWAKLLGSLLYGFNTYFLMLLDGGQIGVALSYGLFPLAAFALNKFWQQYTLKNYLGALVPLFFISNTDLRIFLILLLFVGLWQLINFRGLKTRGFLFQVYKLSKKIGLFNSPKPRKCVISWSVEPRFKKAWVFWEIIKGNFKRLWPLLVLLLSVFSLDAFWIWPFLTNYSTTGAGAILEGGTNLPTFIDSLLLFQPHFPNNEFGKLSAIPALFWLLPIAYLGGLFFSKVAKTKFKLALVLLLLFLAFLAKGGNPPLGQLYDFIINLPSGIAFRDSSKFYIPLILIAGTLIALSCEGIKSRVSYQKQILLFLGFYLYLMGLLYPALSGQLSGALGKTNDVGIFRTAASNIQKQSGFYRTLWFDERPPLAFSSWEKPDLSANLLYQERPFASMIDGRYDLFQYLQSPQLKEWLKLLGVKYVFFPENQRKKSWTEEERVERKSFLELSSSLPLWQPVSWPLSFKAYSIDNPSPHIFAQEKIYLVIGGEEIYRYLLKNNNFSLSGQGLVFLEQGGIELQSLKDIPPEAAKLIFVGKGDNDLLMSSVADLMVSPGKAFKNDWMLRQSSDYLTWKYDLLKQNIRTYEFDFNQGVAFSTVAGEKIEFKLPVPEDGQYYLGVRFTTGNQSRGMKIVALGQEKIVTNPHHSNFVWDIIGPLEIKKGQNKVDIINQGGFAMVNTVALVPKERFLSGQQQAKFFMERFGKIEIKNDNDWALLSNQFSKNFLPVNYRQIDPTQYRINNIPKGGKWLIFTDRYHPDWQLQGVDKNIHLPFYAMVNGFYVGDSPSNMTLIFNPQQEVGWGIAFSVTTFVLILLGVSIITFKRKGKKYV